MNKKRKKIEKLKKFSFFFQGGQLFFITFKEGGGEDRKREEREKKWKSDILPDRLRLQRFAIRATPRWSEPSRPDTAELSLHQFGHASRIDQSQRWQTPASYSWPRHTADSTRFFHH